VILLLGANADVNHTDNVSQSSLKHVRAAFVIFREIIRFDMEFIDIDVRMCIIMSYRISHFLI
jgi:hypothetical protein